MLPGQVFDVLMTFNSAESATCVVRQIHTLHVPDALIANKLLEMGISINPEMLIGIREPLSNLNLLWFEA